MDSERSFRRLAQGGFDSAWTKVTAHPSFPSPEGSGRSEDGGGEAGELEGGGTGLVGHNHPG
jgi:hypothetical protein